MNGACGEPGSDPADTRPGAWIHSRLSMLLRIAAADLEAVFQPLHSDVQKRAGDIWPELEKPSFRYVLPGLPPVRWHTKAGHLASGVGHGTGCHPAPPHRPSQGPSAPEAKNGGLSTQQTQQGRAKFSFAKAPRHSRPQALSLARVVRGSATHSLKLRVLDEGWPDQTGHSQTSARLRRPPWRKA